MEHSRAQFAFAALLSDVGRTDRPQVKRSVLEPWDGRGCPMLLLAPMEVLADRQFRAAAAKVGGMDEMVQEFIRVPDEGHPKSLAKRYYPQEVPIVLSPQVMGSRDEVMYEITRELARRGAYRIDLNCGCPAKRVTRKGSGSSLLKRPTSLGEVVRSMIGQGSNSFPNVTVKMRSGFEDTSLFLENLFSAADAGAKSIAIHPRTSRQLYRGRADWSLIKEAKRSIQLPIVGNGDVRSVEDAVELVENTNCDAVMIGRGAVRNPWIFHEIRSHFEGTGPVAYSLEDEWSFWHTYMITGKQFGASRHANVGRMKMIAQYYFDRCSYLRDAKFHLLRSQESSDEVFVEQIMEVLDQHRRECKDCFSA